MANAGELAAHGARPAPLRPAPILAFGVLALAAAVLVGWVTATHEEWYRGMFATAIAAALLVVAMRSPRLAVLLTLLFLPFLALFRRLLIADAGWTSADPLLLVGPAVALFVLYRLLAIDGRPLAPDRLSKLVVALLALTVVQSFNPANESLLAGLGGLLFLAAPLVWFFVGREVADRALVSTLIYSVIVSAVAIGVYGLLQTESGLPSWDLEWVDVNGFAALNIAGVTRAFGTFSSATEYASYLGTGVLFCVALAVHKRIAVLLALPVLLLALFFSSSRAAMVLALLAVIVLLGLRLGRPSRAIPVIVTGIGVTIALFVALGPRLGQEALRTGDPLVSHGVVGIVHPLDPDDSTLLLHLEGVRDGMVSSLESPLGRGTGVTNLAGGTLGPSSERARGTEVDVSDAFVSLGPLGGLLFVVIIVATFRRVIAAYLARRDAAVLAVVGLLVVTLGEWLNGGHYAIAALTWLLIGWATRPPHDSGGGSPEAVPSASTTHQA
jgi:hypothetical protein